MGLLIQDTTERKVEISIRGEESICIDELHFLGFILHSGGGSTAISTLTKSSKENKNNLNKCWKNFSEVLQTIILVSYEEFLGDRERERNIGTGWLSWVLEKDQ